MVPARVRRSTSSYKAAAASERRQPLLWMGFGSKSREGSLSSIVGLWKGTWDKGCEYG